MIPFTPRSRFGAPTAAHILFFFTLSFLSLTTHAFPLDQSSGITTVTPKVAPSPTIAVPAIAPTAGNFPGGPPVILPRSIPIPIPTDLLSSYSESCSAADFPPISPPIVVSPGSPLPVAGLAPRAEITDEELVDEEAAGNCIEMLSTASTTVSESSGTPKSTTVPRSSGTSKSTTVPRSSGVSKSTTVPSSSGIAGSTTVPRSSGVSKSTTVPGPSPLDASTDEELIDEEAVGNCIELLSTASTAVSGSSVIPNSTTIPKSSGTSKSTTVPRSSGTSKSTTVPRSSNTPESATVPRSSVISKSTTVPRPSGTPKSTTVPRSSGVPNSTAVPKPSGIPDSGQTPTTSGNCDWSGKFRNFAATKIITIASGATHFTVNIFALMHVGPANGISMDGATIQAHSDSVTGWSMSNTPSSPGASCDKNFINFDVPRNPLAREITLRGQVPFGTSTIKLRIQIRASTTCGGDPIPDPAGVSPLIAAEFPRKTDGRIACSKTRTDGGGVADMRDCLWSFGSITVQGQRLSKVSMITTQTPAKNCVRHGTTMAADGVTILNNWCVVYQNCGCAMVISDKYPDHGMFPGYSVISGTVFRNMALSGAKQCAGKGRTAIAEGPFRPSYSSAQTLCLTNPAHPELCGVY